MALRVVPFGASSGFSDQAVGGASYYSQGFTPSLYGTATMYSIINKIDSSTVSGMGNIKYFAIGPGGAMFAQDDNGNVLKEQTPGAFDFAIVRSPGGNGEGLIGDQYGNLLYAQDTQLGKFDGTTWTDNYQSLTSAQHPMDIYEDLRVIANKNAVACLFSDNSWNSGVLTLPSQMNTVAVKAGPTGILVGANFGYQGAIILWDGTSNRSKTPWKWTKGQIIAIDRYGEDWIVKTQRETIITNGYTIKQLFPVFDDPLAFKSYANISVLPQQMTLINDTLIFAITSQANGPLSYEYGKMKPGIYLYALSRKAWGYIPVATGNMIGIDINSLFTDINFNNRILIGYRDHTTGKNYIAQLINTPPSTAIYVSEAIGVGRVHYQRMYFGPTDKTAEAVILNLGILNSITDPATLSFNVAMKIYNFKRQLWGHSMTNAALGSSHKNQLQVDGSSSANYDAQVGDEVTILDGVNAGLIAHISSIANDGANNETWTLDTTFPSATENSIHVQVQPFVLVKKQTFSGLTSLSNLFWSVDSIIGKQFLVKFVLDGIGTNLALELQTSYFVFNDIGYDQYDDSDN